MFTNDPSFLLSVALLWAIMTNRTLLWQYYSTEICYQWSHVNSSSICDSSNQVEDCDQILARAKWMPSYDEWSRKLGLDHPVEIPYYATHPKSVRPWRLYPWHEGDEKLQGADDRQKYPEQVVVFGPSRFKIHWLKNEETQKDLLHTQFGRQTAEQLHQLGVDFMYGMLHRYSFDFAEKSRKGLEGYVDPTEEAFSIALHSRHRYSGADGCDVHSELKCLNQTIQLLNLPVHVYIMSDRPCTISTLSDILHGQNISVHIPPHDEGQSFRDEHGPFAGVGFYQDLALVSKARSAFIGSIRSSSDLLLELVEFHRKMDWWNAGNDITQISNVEKCHLELLNEEDWPDQETTNETLS